MSKFVLWLCAAALLFGQTADNVLVVVNQASPLSRQIGEYYVLRRHIPMSNVCRLNAKADEEISRDDFDKQIAGSHRGLSALRASGRKNPLHRDHFRGALAYPRQRRPARRSGFGGFGTDAAVLRYARRAACSACGHRESFFRQDRRDFRHPDFPIYLVTRLAGYDFADVKGIIDRAFMARNRGKFVIDLKASDNTQGNEWLLQAARALPRDRVVLDESSTVLSDQADVIAYASWGSNDPDRKERHLGFRWLPGAIMTEYVSTNGRTFARPPDTWNIGASWGDPKGLFSGSPQTLTADYIHDGVTGASGHVYEPYLEFTPRPNILLPAYYHGRNLAESYYLAIPLLSWMNIVVGDPLCTLGPP